MVYRRGPPLKFLADPPQLGNELGGVAYCLVSPVDLLKGRDQLFFQKAAAVLLKITVFIGIFA